MTRLSLLKHVAQQFLPISEIIVFMSEHRCHVIAMFMVVHPRK